MQASIAIGGFFGCLLTGFFFRIWFGYKLCQILSCVIGAIGWYLHAFLLLVMYKWPADCFQLLVAARILVGISCGISAYTVPTCVAISSTPQRRHIIGILPPVLMSIGFLICMVSGWSFLHSDVVSGSHFRSIGLQPILGIILSVVGLLVTLVYDERPTNDEWMSYITTADYDPLIGDNIGFVSRIREQLRLLKEKHVQRQLMVGFILPLQQLMGINLVLFKATSMFEPFFKEKSKDPSYPALVGVFIGVLYLFTSIFVPCISHFLKRKLVLYIGGFLIFICHISLALVYYLGNVSSVLLPIIGMIFIMIFCLSWGPFPWLVVSEVFDARIRSSAMTISSCMLWVAMFMITVFYAPLVDLAHSYGLFLLLACFAIVSLIFVHYFIPETKYLSLEEIQEYFKRQSQ